jgi:sugar phosphate isomerase/epimerase
MSNQFPKLHNAMWPGLVGKGPDSEPAIDLDTMLDLTAKAEVNGVRFDGVDLFLFDPHVSIDISDDDLKRVADKIARKGFVVGSVVAPVWPPTGGGSAMGGEEDRKRFVQQVLKACRIASKLRAFGVRPYGIVRIDSATSVDEWAKNPEANTRLIARTFREAAGVAESFGERLAAEGEICWGGMHTWREMVKLLELTDRPKTVGFQADMAHTLLYTLGINGELEDRIVPQSFNWDPDVLDESIRRLTARLRPWTIDFHVAQNDATIHGTGSHDKTGRHCQVNDPNGKLNIDYHSGFWLRDEKGKLTKAVQHICWDGCMFPNAVMLNQQTWNDILRAMISVRDAHGWTEADAKSKKAVQKSAVKITTKGKKRPAKKAKAKKGGAKKKTAKARAKAKRAPKRKPAKAKKAGKKGRKK